MTLTERPANAPYCSNCGYVLTGLTESSKCPECGKPLVEVLTRPGREFPNIGKRYRSKATLFGLPVIDVALGPMEGEPRGKAKGIIAIGDVAIGGVALGGVASGVVALGGVAFGLFALGGVGIGLVTATGGVAVGGMASGGGAAGVLANGGGAVGLVAQGGGAFGLFTRDGRSFGRGGSPGSDVFDTLSWFFGTSLADPSAFWRPVAVTAGAALLVGALIGLVAWLKLLREPGPAGSA